jgi:putative acetyltransferase
MDAALDAVIRRQSPDDAAGVRAVIRDAFATHPEVVDLEQALGARTDSAGYVALVGERVVGQVRLTRGWVDAEPRLVEILVLSPLSVASDWQGRGFGRALLARAKHEAADAGAPAVFLEGDPAYYRPLGWLPASDLGVTPPSSRIPGPASLAVRLPAWEPWMRGRLVYPDTFWTFDCVGLRGDRLAQVIAHVGHGARAPSADNVGGSNAGFVIRRWDLEYHDGDEAPAHVHDGSDEAFCVLRGRLEVLVGDERRILQAGQHLTIPAGTTHTFATVDQNGADILAVMTPEVDELVTELHAPLSDEERAAVWKRHRSTPV